MSSLTSISPVLIPIFLFPSPFPCTRPWVSIACSHSFFPSFIRETLLSFSMSIPDSHYISLFIFRLSPAPCVFCCRYSFHSQLCPLHWRALFPLFTCLQQTDMHCALNCFTTTEISTILFSCLPGTRFDPLTRQHHLMRLIIIWILTAQLSLFSHPLAFLAFSVYTDSSPHDSIKMGLKQSVYYICDLQPLLNM